MYTKPLLTAVISLLLFPTASLAQYPPSSTKTDRSSVVGFTEPYRAIDVAANEMGALASVEVKEGDIVKKGAILARLNEDVLNAALKMADCSNRGRGKLKSAEAELRMQQERLQKLQGLFHRHHASQVEIDRSISQVEIAQAKVEAVHDEMELQTFEMKRIEAQLEQRRLRSPIDGIVTRVLKDEGEFVSANDPVVAHVVQLNPLLVIFSVPQQTASQLSAGQQVELVIGNIAENGRGLIEFVSPAADAQSNTCRVKVKIENPDLAWPSGVECKLVLNDDHSKQPPTVLQTSNGQSVAKK